MTPYQAYGWSTPYKAYGPSTPYQAYGAGDGGLHVQQAPRVGYSGLSEFLCKQFDPALRIMQGIAVLFGQLGEKTLFDEAITQVRFVHLLFS